MVVSIEPEFVVKIAINLWNELFITAEGIAIFMKLE